MFASILSLPVVVIAPGALAGNLNVFFVGTCVAINAPDAKA